MTYKIEKSQHRKGEWRIANGVTFLAGFLSKAEAQFFIRKYSLHRSAGAEEQAAEESGKLGV